MLARQLAPKPTCCNTCLATWVHMHAIPLQARAAAATAHQELLVIKGVVRGEHSQELRGAQRNIQPNFLRGWQAGQHMTGRRLAYSRVPQSPSTACLRPCYCQQSPGLLRGLANHQPRHAAGARPEGRQPAALPISAHGHNKLGTTDHTCYPHPQ